MEKNLISVGDTRTKFEDIPFFTILGIPEIDDRTFISSPGYPTSYSENTYCYWEVDVPYDVEVILEFNPRSVTFDRPHFIWPISYDRISYGYDGPRNC